MGACYTHVPTELNNRGAMRLVNGKYQEATMLFTEALDSAMGLQELATLAKNDCNKECAGMEIKVAYTNGKSDWSCGVNFAVSLSSCYNQYSSRFDHIIDDMLLVPNPLGGGHIFRSPLLLFHNSPRIGPPGYTVLELCTITYNLSLSYHLQGIADNVNSALLDNARGLYEKTLQLQQMAPPGHRQLQIGIFLHMCLVNNLAMIHTALDNEGKSREYLGRVLSDIQYILECGNEERRYYHELLDGFIDNTMPLILMDSALAPAA